MGPLVIFAIQAGILLALLGLSLIVGGAIHQRHLQSLDAREHATKTFLVTQLKSFPQQARGTHTPTMLSAEVVISSDYLKTFLGVLQSLFGGEVRSFQTLLDRARREALLRLKEEAIQLGYDAICNVRLETADIAGRGANQKNKMFMASVLACGTAYSTNRSIAAG